ncbi:MAG: hypothetical protein ACI9MJ_002247 [Alphaproteobacteria bacterium]
MLYAGAYVIDGGAGTYLCSGTAGVDTTQTLSGAPLTVTTSSGFGITTATGSALVLTSMGGLSFTDNIPPRLLAPRAGLMLEGQFLPGWTRLIAPAVARAARADKSLAERKRFCAQEMIRVSVENLMTFPFVLGGAYSVRFGIQTGFRRDICPARRRFFI